MTTILPGSRRKGPHPTIRRLIKHSGRSTRWTVEIDEGVLTNITSRQLTNYNKFAVACADQLTCFFQPMRQSDWVADVLMQTPVEEVAA